MKVAVHQPNYLPWIGYFYKIYLSDIFIFHDDVQFSKSSYTRRVKVKQSKSTIDTKWLSVPIRRQSDSTLIKDVFISNDTDWWTSHKNILSNAYSHLPHYDKVMKVVEDAKVEVVSNELALMNSAIIMAISEYMGFQKKFLHSKDLRALGSKSAKNIALVKAVDGNTYISGTGAASSYQSETEYIEAGLDLIIADVAALSQNVKGVLPDILEQHTFDVTFLEWLFRYDVEDIMKLFRDAKV